METDPRKAAVAAAIARVKAKKAQQAQATAEIDTPAEAQAEVETDPRKAAVAAAIARVKAKKAQQAQRSNCRNRTHLLKLRLRWKPIHVKLLSPLLLLG